MKIFECDTQWPLCLYDFTYKNKIPQFLCFKTSSEPPIIIDDYFNMDLLTNPPSPVKYKHSILTRSVASSSASGSTEGLLMERGAH